MSHKIHPYGFRVGVTKPWISRWFATRRDYGALAVEDEQIRRLIMKRFPEGAIARIEVLRTRGETVVTIHTARTGVVVGRQGAAIEQLRADIRRTLQRKRIEIKVEEVENPRLCAAVVADTIAHQIAKRFPFRRAAKQAIEGVMQAGAKGIKIDIAGRLNGGDIARAEHFKEGATPLQTLRADIDFARKTAASASGSIGVKVWVYKGDAVRKAKTD